MQQGEEEPRVLTGPDRDVFEHLGGLRLTRVDDEDPAAALDDAGHVLADARVVDEAHLRDPRVRAEHQQHLGAGDVRDRHVGAVPVEHLERGDAGRSVLGVDPVEPRRTEGDREVLAPERGGVGEVRRVALVHGERALPVPIAQRLETRGDVVQRLVPGAGLELTRATDALHRREQPVGVVDDLGHCDALGAEESLAVRVVLVGAELDQLAVLDGRDQAALRFADAAVRGLLGGGHRGGHSGGHGAASRAVGGRRSTRHPRPKLP